MTSANKIIYVIEHLDSESTSNYVAHTPLDQCSSILCGSNCVLKEQEEEEEEE